MQHHWKESHKVNRCLPGGASTTAQYDWQWSDAQDDGTRKMCPPETEQKKMSFSHCRKHLAGRKGHLEKANSTLERMMSCMQRVFSLCRQRMYERPHRTANKSVQDISEDGKRYRPEMRKQHVAQWTLKTEAGNEITAKNSDGGGAEAKEAYLGALEAGFLLWPHLHLQRRQARSSYTDHLQEAPVTLCICVRQPQQRRALCCCSLEWNPTWWGHELGLFHLR